MTRVRRCRAAAVTLLVGVAAAACTNTTEPSEGGGSGGTATATATTTSARPSPSTTIEPPSPSPSPSSPMPSASSLVLTEDDSGRTVTLRSSGTAHLQLSNDLQWESPSAAVNAGRPAVVLVPVDYESDPGFRAWEVRALHPGDAVIRATGRPGPRHVRITVHVTE